MSICGMYRLLATVGRIMLFAMLEMNLQLFGAGFPRWCCSTWRRGCWTTFILLRCETCDEDARYLTILKCDEDVSVVLGRRKEDGWWRASTRPGLAWVAVACLGGCVDSACALPQQGRARVDSPELALSISLSDSPCGYRRLLPQKGDQAWPAQPLRSRSPLSSSKPRRLSFG